MPRKKKPLCHYCDKPAEFYCDGIIECKGYSKVISEAVRDKKELSAEEWIHALNHLDALHVETCDRPLCEKHTKHAGTLFVCGEKGFAESIDYCPRHATWNDPEPPPFRPITGTQCA